MQRTEKDMIVDIAGIRWYVNAIENRAVERYMASRDNIYQIAALLRDLHQNLSPLGVRGAPPPRTWIEPSGECEWEWCPDGKCLMDCHPDPHPLKAFENEAAGKIPAPTVPPPQVRWPRGVAPPIPKS